MAFEHSQLERSLVIFVPTNVGRLIYIELTTVELKQEN